MVFWFGVRIFYLIYITLNHTHIYDEDTYTYVVSYTYVCCGQRWEIVAKRIPFFSAQHLTYISEDIIHSYIVSHMVVYDVYIYMDILIC